MDDVVEDGRRDRWVPPRWLGASTLAVAVSLAALGVTRPHLLSAGTPAPDRPSRAANTNPANPTQPLQPGGNTGQGISIVVRQGDHLERYEAGFGRRPLATLPSGLPDPVTLVHAPLAGGSGPLVGVAGHVLFRTSPVRGHTVTPIGLADTVLAVSPRPGRLFVLQPGAAYHRGRLVELNARSGDVTDGLPFPGYDPTGAWRPAGVVSLRDRRALVLTRAAGEGRLALALAWDRVSVGSGAAAFTRIGSTSQLLGIAQTHILAVDDRPDTCVDRGCPITVFTVTADVGVLARAVQPPPGWTYRKTIVGGDGGDPLAVVSAIDDPDRRGLARLFGGGRLGLFVAGSDGLVGAVRPIDGPEGSVVFAGSRPEGIRLFVLMSGSQSAALLHDLPALEPGAELVCACG